MNRSKSQRRRRPPRRAVPTRAGLFALGAPIVLGVAAVNATNNLLFILLGAVLGSIVVSGILSERNMRGVRVTVRALSPPYAGEPARLFVGLDRSPDAADQPGFALAVRELAGDGWMDYFRRLPGGLWVTVPVIEGTRVERIGTRIFARRGPARLGDCELMTRFPFGLLTKARDVDVELDVLVRPRRITAPESLADPGRIGDEGDFAERRGIGLELYGLREREDRDSVHRIHGLRSLALGRDVVIETAGIERPTAWLGIANRAGASPEALERALELAQALILEWDARGHAVGLATVSFRIPPGAESLDGLLDYLAALEVEPGEMGDAGAGLWIVPLGASAPSGARLAVHVDDGGQLRLSGVDGSGA